MKLILLSINKFFHVSKMEMDARELLLLSTIFIGAHPNMCTSHVMCDTYSVCYPFGDIKEVEEEHPENAAAELATCKET